ncbi:putative pseudouridine synthase, RluA family [Candidatus Zinderia insecticola CARI]|uniref:Putative pseudouridine synthase, RluA family n=1 Tax=Zinderia insecticola (strain CARI) TaxID=871271 RepID=E0TIV6_ZINIC|nr:putative pseudouridine synthase, RluA family [Candidatus Zinderia insecticola CARI]
MKITFFIYYKYIKKKKKYLFKKLIPYNSFKIIKLIYYFFKKNKYIFLYIKKKKNKKIKENIKINIIFKNKNLLIINKNDNFLIHPNNNTHNGTIFNFFLYKKNNNKIPRLGIINRIDKNTFGLIIIIKNIYSYFYFIYQFKFNTIKKKYICLVWGKVKNNNFINFSIIKNKKKYNKMIVNKNKKSNIITKYKIINYNKFNNLYISLLNIKLITGKMHQIRIHMKNIKHSILGDILYEKNKNKKFFFQFLQFYKIIFINNENKKLYKIKINLNKKFLFFLKKLKINFNFKKY